MTSAKHPQPYAISVMGLDRYQNSNPGDATADKQTDFGSQFTQDDFILEPKTGTLVFPYLEPFGDRVKRFYQAQTQIAGKPLFDSNFYLPEVYTRQQEELRNKETKQVSISIRFSGGVSATLNLNAYNLVEGSVKVTVGATHTRNNAGRSALSDGGCAGPVSLEG